MTLSVNEGECLKGSAKNWQFWRKSRQLDVQICFRIIISCKIHKNLFAVAAPLVQVFKSSIILPLKPNQTNHTYNISEIREMIDWNNLYSENRSLV